MTLVARRRMWGLPWLASLMLTAADPLAAQATAGPLRASSRAPEPPVLVDQRGVLRWRADGREVALFGVNYAAPFAYDFRAIATLGVDHKRAIDQDVAHLARLGIDAFRIHVWDREVSDADGNLLANVHLDLLDYLIAQLSARGIRTLLTPIAWWGPGYPEPDPPSPGFANRYTKPQMAVDSIAVRAQERYVAQFVAHVNPYTGRSYRDDPEVLAFEVFNEPWHDLATPAQTTQYINRLAGAMRRAGVRKPIFYNISEHFTPEHGRAVCAADIQGVSAQWYPTGLVRGEALPGNPLPNVDAYPLPWQATPACRNKAHMVYEFDGADVAVPIMYPAMARAFRGAGFQWATQFAYDPLAVARTNTEYQTHFLNLVYTPAKAISFLIAGEVFRRTPRGADAGVYPASERFGQFRVSYADRVSELVSDTIYVHAGNTTTPALNTTALRHVAGVGRSPVAQYNGTGAYFLDRVASGVWRLEVFPDAIDIDEPYSRGNLRRPVTRVYWRTHQLRLSLPDLGDVFRAEAIDSGNTFRPQIASGGLSVRPGVYLLTRQGVTLDSSVRTRPFKGRPLADYHAPPPSAGATVLRHEPPTAVIEGSSFTVDVDVVQPDEADSARVFVRYAGWQGFRRADVLVRNGPYRFSGTVPLDTGRTGPLEYVITTYKGDRAATYPGAVAGAPSDWDFVVSAAWHTRVLPRTAPIPLFDADRDRSRVVHPGYVPGAQVRSEWKVGSHAEATAWWLGVDRFGPTATHVTFRSMLREGTRDLIARERLAIGSDAALRVRLRAPQGDDVPIEIGVVLADGSAWGTTTRAGAEWRDVTLPLRDFRQVPLALIPRPYPTFLPYALTASRTAGLSDLRALEGIQWGFPRASAATDDRAVHVEIESVHLLRTGQR